MAEKTAITLTKKQHRMGISMGVIFACMMFILGVMVGRGFSPVQFDIRSMETKLLSAKSDETRSKTNNTGKRDHAEGSLEKEPEIKFYETLEENSEEINLNRQAAAPKKTKIIKKKTVIKKNPAANANRVYQGEKKEKSSSVTKLPKHTKPAASAKKPAPVAKSGKYAIQVAALKDSGTASKIAIKLNKQKFPVYIEKSKSGGNVTWHRVKIGPYKNKIDAEKVLIRLKLSKFDGFITGS